MQARLYKTASFLALMTACAAAPAQAQAPAEFYKGKNVTVLVGPIPIVARMEDSGDDWRSWNLSRQIAHDELPVRTFTC